MIYQATKRNKRNAHAQKEGRMNSSKCMTDARVRTGTNASTSTKTNPLNLCYRVSCSCGKMCKSSRGLKVHQAKLKRQISQNKLKAPPKKCFVSLQDTISPSYLAFEDQIYFKTSEETFIPVSSNNKNNKPVFGKKCFIQTNDMIVNPLTECLSNYITPNIMLHLQYFISDQVFRSNLTGKEYKTITYDRLSCGSTSVIFGIYYVHLWSCLGAVQYLLYNRASAE